MGAKFNNPNPLHCILQFNSKEHQLIWLKFYLANLNKECLKFVGRVTRWQNMEHSESIYDVIRVALSFEHLTV